VRKRRETRGSRNAGSWTCSRLQMQRHGQGPESCLRDGMQETGALQWKTPVTRRLGAERR